MTEKRKKLLLVDDSVVTCEELARILQPHGYDVVAVASPFQLVGAALIEKPDLILVDVGMPAISGDKVIEFAVRSQQVKCPMVLFSARGKAELERLVRSCGANGYIMKSANEGDLLRAVKRFIAA